MALRFCFNIICHILVDFLNVTSDLREIPYARLDQTRDFRVGMEMVRKPSKVRMDAELYKVNRCSQHRMIKSQGLPDSGSHTVKLRVPERMWWERKGVI